MTKLLLLFIGALATITFALVLLVAVPGYTLSLGSTTTNVPPYTEEELAGRAVYMANGCVYCHSQQVRDPAITNDMVRQWGRPSYPSDYAHDQPALLGTMRTGPDLINVGQRLPNAQWHLLHLYQPRAVVPWSIMPPFPFLFEHKDVAGPDDSVLVVPESFAPPGKVVVVTEEAQALVVYLLSLRRDVEPLELTEAEAPEAVP